jgi:hypothetical protein
MSLKDLDEALNDMMETSAMAAGVVSGPAMVDDPLEEEELSEESKLVENEIRKYIQKRIIEIKMQQAKIIQERREEEKELRKIIRQLLKEADVSDVHPHRSTAINVLEELLKKMIPTLRADYKRLTTDETQRESFRAHVVKAIKDSLMPSLVNDEYGSVPGGAILSAPPEEEFEIEDEEDLKLESELHMLDEIEVDIDDEPDQEKKIPVEDDDTPTEEESFGAGLEAMDETGRNMAYASYKKVQQYILDSYDTLANREDKKIFVDYLITNVKLYFDKFEDELQKTVEEPTTDEYEKAKTDSL